MVIDLDNGRQVVIALAPAFAPVHVANVRIMARTGWYDGLTVNRVQDNYVTQWGDVTDKKVMPPKAVAIPPAEYERSVKGLAFHAMPYRDAYAPQAGHAGIWPVASDGKSAWLVHCYGMVGAGRSDAVDSSNGTELYVVIGQAPRGLDLNITVVGRVLKGMELLSALPRGAAAMGFYDKPEQRTGIQRISLLAELPPAERPALQVLKTESATWTQLLDARRYRGGWFVHSPGHIEVCSASVPTRPTPQPPK